MKAKEFFLKGVGKIKNFRLTRKDFTGERVFGY